MAYIWFIYGLYIYIYGFYMADIWLIYFVAVNMHVICKFHAGQNIS